MPSENAKEIRENARSGNLRLFCSYSKPRRRFLEFADTQLSSSSRRTTNGNPAKADESDVSRRVHRTRRYGKRNLLSFLQKEQHEHDATAARCYENDLA